MSLLLKVGDQVRAGVASLVPAGTLGRVTMTLIGDLDLYFVQFDGYDRPMLMYVGDLDRVPEQSTTEHTVSEQRKRPGDESGRRAGGGYEP